MVTLQAVNDKYGSYIWAIARRYHTGIWDSEDVFTEVLLQVYAAIKVGKLSFDDDDYSILSVKGYIINRAIDILRVEIRRYMTHFDDDVNKEGILEPAASESPESQELELKLIKELLSDKLSKKVADFIYELAFPSSATVKIALQEQEESKNKVTNGELKMNVHKLRILPRHVSKMYKMKHNKQITKQMIAKMRGEAQKVLRDYFEIAGVSNVESIVDEILGSK